MLTFVPPAFVMLQDNSNLVTTVLRLSDDSHTQATTFSQVATAHTICQTVSVSALTNLQTTELERREVSTLAGRR
jgi:hypothetical protein